MPTYEYECSSCGKHFDIIQSMKDEPLSSCPECKGRMRRLIGGGLGIIFKGSGFYSTDHKRSGASTGDSTSKASTTKKEENKSDSGNTNDAKELKPAV